MHSGHYRIRTGGQRIKSPLLYLTKLSAQVDAAAAAQAGPLGTDRKARRMTMEREDDVEDYLAARAPAQQPVLRRVRDLIRAEAPEATEGLSYGMPAYRLGGRPLLYFGAFAAHWSLFPAGDVSRLGPELEARVADHRAGKGTLKFPYADSVPEDLVRAIVRERVRQNRAASPQA